MKPPNFLAELKRRNVFRVAGLYLVGAWLVIQVASTVLPAFEVPNWALRGLIITLALGFVSALIFSWVFELTSQGLKRDEDVSAGRIDRAADRAADGSHDHCGARARAGVFCFRQIRACAPPSFALNGYNLQRPAPSQSRFCLSRT